MPSLDDLLRQTMLFTATKGGEGLNALAWPYRTPTPTPKTAAALGDGFTAEIVRNNPIWQLSWSPLQPGIFRQITLLSRGMGMDYSMPVTAYDSLEFRDVQLVRSEGETVNLPLDPAHMIGAWEGRAGWITPKLSDNFRDPTNIWKLDTRIDSSLLVAFGYRLDGAEPSRLSMAQCEALGDDLMPPPGTVRRPLTFTAREGARARVRVDYPRYIVVVELVLCRENPDFVPGDMVGFARIHPHAMVWSTEALERVETTILMARPRKAMTHNDSAMHTRHKALVVTDTNELRLYSETSLTLNKPVPYADAIYDYYEVDPAKMFKDRAPTDTDHPLQRKGEVTLADARFTAARRIVDAVERRSLRTTNDRDFLKMPRQGQFDNVHIAPRMRLVASRDGSEDVVLDDDIAMVFVCLHDCCHMHVRWSALFDDIQLRGWGNRSRRAADSDADPADPGRPNEVPGAPAVPRNQTVFASFPNEHTLRYRAIAEPVAAGDLSVFCHHGLAYAVHVWPDQPLVFNVDNLLGGLELLADNTNEPYHDWTPEDEWAMFYFRVRFTGRAGETDEGWRVYERLHFEDLERCMR